MSDVQARLDDINSRIAAALAETYRLKAAANAAICLVITLAVFGLCALAEEPLRQQDLKNQENVHVTTR